MQFAVPQFTEVEDRLIGSLTLKQFLVLLAAGAVCLVIWTIFGPSIIFFLLSLPVAVLGVASALGRYNGRPLFTYLLPFAAFVASEKLMIFKREAVVISVSKKEVQSAEKEQTAEEAEPADSRLKKLAYMLDQKSAEEKDIISNDDRQIIRATAMPKIDLNQVLRKAKDDIIATAKKLDIEKPSPTLATRLPKTPPKRKVMPVRTDLPEMPKPKSRKAAKSDGFDPSSFLS